MADYTGAECLSCGKKFESGDDIVVCPECGTPYHRECYLKEGKCINNELHENGQSWSKGSSQEQSEDSIRCIRCGAENPADKIFCEKCGTPLLKNNEQDSVPFNNVNSENKGSDPQFNPNMGAQNGVFGQQMVFDKNSELDGIKLDDYAKYVGPNPLGFLTNFIRFSKFGGKVSFNFCAMLFPSVYFLFRKMKGIGILLLTLCSVLQVPLMIETLITGYAGVKFNLPVDVKSQSFLMVANASNYLLLIIRILAGLFANYIYFKQAKKNIIQIKNEESSDETVSAKIKAKGGTSLGLGIIALLIESIIQVGIIFGLNKFA